MVLNFCRRLTERFNFGIFDQLVLGVNASAGDNGNEQLRHDSEKYSNNEEIHAEPTHNDAVETPERLPEPVSPPAAPEPAILHVEENDRPRSTSPPNSARDRGSFSSRQPPSSAPAKFTSGKKHGYYRKQESPPASSFHAAINPEETDPSDLFSKSFT